VAQVLSFNPKSHLRGAASVHQQRELRPQFQDTERRKREKDMYRLKSIALVSLLLLIPALARPQATVNENLETASIYVDAVNGSDANPGTIAQPLKTIGAAVTMAESNNQNNVGSRVIIDPGTYREAVSVAPAHKPTGMPITFQAATNGTVFVSGAQQYTDWQAYPRNNAMYTTSWPYSWGLCTPAPSAPLPLPDITMRREMVFVNGAALTEVASLTAMTVPATFYVDETGGTLYIWPPTGTNISTADVEVSTEPTVWSIQGQSNVVVRGLTFEYGNPCREYAEVTLSAPGTTAQNVIFDSDAFLWSNAQGLQITSSASYFTVQNSVANYNGEAGFQAAMVKYGLYQSDQASFNGWRGAQGAYYAFNAGGLHTYEMHNLTLQGVNTSYNQTYGVHFDTDHLNVSASSMLSSQNLLFGMFVEANEGPVSFANSTFCGGSPSAFLSNSSFALRDSENVTVTGSNLLNSNAAVTVIGVAGGLERTNWETGQIYDLMNENFTLKNNALEALNGQDVFSDASLGGNDWQTFQSTLLSNNNTWWSPDNTMAYMVPVPNNNTAADFASWQTTTGQDTQSSWAAASGSSPAAACSVPTGAVDYWFVVPYTQTSLTVSPGNSAVWTANVVPLGFTGTVALSHDGIENIPGATAGWSANSVGPNGVANFTVTPGQNTPAGTYPVTMIANSGNLTHTITALLVVDNTVRLSSESLAFGNQPVATTSATQSVTVTNTASAALAITSISVGGPNGSSFGQSNNCGASLPADSSCTITVTFTPAVTGARTAAVTINDSDPTSPQQIALTGTGTAPAPVLSPSSLTFGPETIGAKSAAQALTLNNAGSAPLTITSIALTGAGSSDFAQTNNCGSSVAAGSSCVINVTFDPAKTGTRSATLTVTGNATPKTQTASLSGQGTQAAANLSPRSLSFGTVVYGVTGAAKTVTLTNTGTAMLSITSLAITGANSADFAQTNTCGTSVGVGASCWINVTFTARALGSMSASVTVTDNAPGSPQTVSLSGTGTTSVLFSPKTITFAAIKAGTKSSVKTVTVNNLGKTLAMYSVAISGANASDFAETNTCGTVLGAAASCTISVTFSPTAVGTRTAIIKINDADPSSPQQVTLSGTGE
jgi:hypothetical protein